MTASCYMESSVSRSVFLKADDRYPNTVLVSVYCLTCLSNACRSTSKAAVHSGSPHARQHVPARAGMRVPRSGEHDYENSITYACQRNASASACCWKNSIGRHPAKQKDAASFAMFRAGAVRFIILRKGVLMPLTGGSRAESAEPASAKHRCGSSWLPHRTEGATFCVAYRANCFTSGESMAMHSTFCTEREA